MIKPNSKFTVFTVEYLDKEKAFYSKHFNFSVAFENEWYLHLVSGSGIQVGFLLLDQPTQPAVFHLSFNGNGVIWSLEIDDVDSAYLAATDKSFNIVLELRSEDWGQRHFSIQDPKNIYLDIVQVIEPTDENQQGYDKT